MPCSIWTIVQTYSILHHLIPSLFRGIRFVDMFLIMCSGIAMFPDLMSELCFLTKNHNVDDFIFETVVMYDDGQLTKFTVCISWPPFLSVLNFELTINGEIWRYWCSNVD